MSAPRDPEGTGRGAPSMVALEPATCLLCGADDATPVVRSAAQMSSRGGVFTFVRCRRCGLVYLNPRVPEEEIGAWYGPDYLPHRGEAAWGRYAAFAAEGQRRTDRARVRWTVRYAAPSRTSVVLDVGCGRPTYLEALHRRTGARGVGLDFSDAGWRNDPERWEAAGLELHHGRLEEAGLQRRFDAITMWHALEHDYRPLDTLRRLRDLANDGATLLVEVPNHEALTRRLHGSAWAGYHTPRHTAVFTPRTLGAVLERAGWRLVRQHAHGTLDPYVLWWLGRQERAGRPLDGELGSRFPSFMAGKLLTMPVALAQRWVSLGVQFAVARATG
ncbi:MAG: class I SAM-dependent methyltransferase [Gemmatimonadales bacterium]